MPSGSHSEFRYTNGLSPYVLDASGNRAASHVWETYSGSIEFTVDGLCWYLDATFCSYFHSMKSFADAQTIKLVLQLIIFALWITAGILVLYQVGSAVRVQCDRHGSKSCRTRCLKSIEELASWSLLGTSLRVVLIVSPSLFYVNIFLPCWECYDFEASALHELGHILGLGHPDLVNQEQIERCASCGCCQPTSTEQNLYSVASSATNLSDACINTFDYVYTGVSPNTEAADLVNGVVDAIMISFTQFNSQPCLTLDDVQALNALYPVCGPVISDTPSCYSVRHNIGWVRVMVYVLLPGVLAMLVMLCIGSITQSTTRKRLNSARILLQKNRSFVRRANLTVEQERERAEQAIAALESQREAEDVRIEQSILERISRMTMNSASSAEEGGAPAAASEHSTNPAPSEQSSGTFVNVPSSQSLASTGNSEERVVEGPAAAPQVQSPDNSNHGAVQRSPHCERYGSSTLHGSAQTPRLLTSGSSERVDTRRAPLRNEVASRQPPAYNYDVDSALSEDSGWLARLDLSARRI